MIPRRELPSKEKLHALFLYDLSVGNLFWRKRTKETFPDSSQAMLDGWNQRYAGKRIRCVANNGFIVVNIGGQVYLAHRIIYKMHTGSDPHIIDHIDRDRLNNRIENLRVADDSINAWNSGKKRRNTSGYKGVVYQEPTNTWAAKVGYKRKLVHGGNFLSKEEAYEAACTLRTKLHGEFACHG